MDKGIKTVYGSNQRSSKDKLQPIYLSEPAAPLTSIDLTQ